MLLIDSVKRYFYTAHNGDLFGKLYFECLEYFYLAWNILRVVESEEPPERE